MTSWSCESHRQDFLISFTRNSPRTPEISHILPAVQCRPELNEMSGSQLSPHVRTKTRWHQSQNILWSPYIGVSFCCHHHHQPSTSYAQWDVMVCAKTFVHFLGNGGLLSEAFKKVVTEDYWARIIERGIQESVSFLSYGSSEIFYEFHDRLCI
jgi:hypothetical protein